MNLITKKLEEIQPGEHFISVTQGMRGWFACEFWINNEEPDLGAFVEPWQSDDSSFLTRAEAQNWAKLLAEAEDLPYVE